MIKNSSINKICARDNRNKTIIGISFPFLLYIDLLKNTKF